MIFTSYASSSDGNLYEVSDGRTRLLLECGITFKRLQEALGFEFTGIQGCLLSHEHQDHAKAAKQLLKAGIPIYCSEGTMEALELPCEPLEAGQQVQIGTMEIMPFGVFHDAAEPLGFLIYSHVDGERLVFATDTVALRYRFPGLNKLAIEANFSMDTLDRLEKMPEKVRHRIQNTHMEIDRLCDYLKELDMTDCTDIYLLHLSDSCSHEGYFINKVRNCIPKNVQVTACRKVGG